MTGLFYDLPMSEYKAIDALSKHQLDDINISIAYWQHRKTVGIKPSNSMLFGSAFHDFVLLPEQAGKLWVVSPKFDLRKKEDKEAKAEFEKTANGREVIDFEAMDRIRCMSDALFSHPTASELLYKTTNEVSAVKEYEGYKFKSRADILGVDYIADLKTTSAMSFQEFKYEFFKYRYDVQAAAYLETFDMRGCSFYFIVCQSVAPYDVFVCEMNNERLSRAYEKYSDDIAKYLLWKGGNLYAGISDDILCID
ncbi:MAG: PD-(D/E)XK nuclease-like domain-containing protein [Candidatus Methylopumilus sp.]|nr:PD-(D/E)XK nuclease-like domain-containing protein [Candidatus Methylopumilus sp.]